MRPLGCRPEPVVGNEDEALQLLRTSPSVDGDSDHQSWNRQEASLDATTGVCHASSRSRAVACLPFLALALLITIVTSGRRHWLRGTSGSHAAAEEKFQYGYTTPTADVSGTGAGVASDPQNAFAAMGDGMQGQATMGQGMQGQFADPSSYAPAGNSFGPNGGFGDQGTADAMPGVMPGADSTMDAGSVGGAFGGGLDAAPISGDEEGTGAGASFEGALAAAASSQGAGDFSPTAETDYAEFGTNYKTESADGGCGNSLQLNDFSSKKGMETAGWWFNWTDDFTFKPLMYKDFVPPYSYWGFEMHGSGAISLKINGEGILTLDFGNLLGTPGSRVSVFLNLDKKASAGPSVLSKTVSIPFHNADALTIVQDRTGIIVINRISFKCTQAASTSPVPFASTTTEDPIKLAEVRWKEEHAALQKAASLAEKKQQVLYAALKLVKRQKAQLKDLEHHESGLKKKLEQEKHATAKAKAMEDTQNNKMVKALMQILNNKNGAQKFEALLQDASGGDGTDAVAEGPLQEEWRVLKEAKEQAKLARNLVRATSDGGSTQDYASAQTLREQAEAELTAAQSALNRAQRLLDHLDTVHRNVSLTQDGLKNAEDQVQRSRQELAVAEAAEDEQAKKSSEAAKIMKQLVSKRQEVIAKMKEEAKKKKERQQEQKAKEEVAQEVVTTTVTMTTTTSSTTDGGLGVSLWCYALMLPFGYEPELLAAQEQQKVGIFNCDQHVIFTNSSTLLDKSKKPLDSVLSTRVSMLDFTLSVPYGGEWHTALNTPVFNKIWAKVVDMGEYLKYDWVVKADPDTVWFPSRLRDVLRKGLPKGLLAGPPDHESRNCKYCKMPGHTEDTCEQHVKWLQVKKGFTCKEALASVAKADDCDCHCTHFQACKLESLLLEENWAKDGHYIRGRIYGQDSKPGQPHPDARIYINNCKFGLHGPIEVLSSGAVSAFVHEMHTCDFLLDEPWGEDKFIDRCLLELGVARVNVFGMLSETACSEEPAPCGSSDVAFHPFKKFEDYFACWAFAHDFGHGPASKPKLRHARFAQDVP